MVGKFRVKAAPPRGRATPSEPAPARAPNQQIRGVFGHQPVSAAARIISLGSTAMIADNVSAQDGGIRGRGRSRTTADSQDGARP